MLDIGPAAKKTMTRHAPIKLLLKSLLLAHFHSVSFCLVSGWDLQVSGCDIRDSVLSTPNRLYKDARQKNSNAARAFISLGMKGSGESKRGASSGWRVRRKRKSLGQQNKVGEGNKEYGYGFFMVLWTEGETMLKQRGEKVGRNEQAFSFFLVFFALCGYRRSKPASLFYQKKMLIINLRLLATSLFNSW